MIISGLLERMAQWSDKPAIVWNDQVFPYGKIIETTYRWYNILKTENIDPGKVVALEGDYSPNSIAMLLALINNKNIIVPLSAIAKHNREKFLNIAEVQVIAHKNENDQYKLQIRNTAVKNKLILSLSKQSIPGLVLFSSGSTGKNKAILHNFDILLAKYKSLRKRMCTLVFLLMDHIGGINTLFYTLSNGGTAVTVSDRNPNTVCSTIERYKVELLPTSPTFINLLLLSGAHHDYDLSSLRLITYGTEIMPANILKRIRKYLPNVKLTQTYGLSEIGIMSSKSKNSDSLLVKIGGTGFETKIVDGILWIRADSAMVGYLNAPNPFDKEGWMNTEDMAEVHGDYIRILGRASEIINVGGQKLYPAEVENILMGLKNVKDVTVRGEKNPITGDIVVAKVSLIKSESVSNFKKRMRIFCKDRLERYKIPVKVELSNGLHHNERFKKIRT